MHKSRMDNDANRGCRACASTNPLNPDGGFFARADGDKDSASGREGQIAFRSPTEEGKTAQNRKRLCAVVTYRTGYQPAELRPIAILTRLLHSDDCDARRQRSPLNTRIVRPTLTPYRSPVLAVDFNSTQACNRNATLRRTEMHASRRRCKKKNMPMLALIYIIFRGRSKEYSPSHYSTAHSDFLRHQRSQRRNCKSVRLRRWRLNNLSVSRPTDSIIDRKRLRRLIDKCCIRLQDRQNSPGAAKSKRPAAMHLPRSDSPPLHHLLTRYRG